MSNQRERLLRRANGAIAAAALTGFSLVTCALPGMAQAQYQVSDTQLQASVSTALHADSKLNSTGNSTILVKASQGVVTLVGDVASEDARTEAEQVTAGVSGVRSIQDNINVGSAPDTAGSGQPASGQPTGVVGQAGQENLPPPPPDEEAAGPSQQPAIEGSRPQYTPYPQQGTRQQTQQSLPYGQAQPYPSDGYPPQHGRPDYGPRGNSHVPEPYPQQAPRHSSQPYSQQGSSFGVAPQLQDASGPVTIPPGTLLSVRTMQPLSTGNLNGDEFFDVTAATDVYANNVIAIPRGAVLTGQVVEAKNAGPFGGSPKLDLRLTAVHLGPATFPLVSEIWTSQGASKTGYTAINTIGGSALGAIIGAAAGGGVGAGIGAIAGGASGALISGATHGPRLDLPPEALLQFHIEEPLTLQPVAYSEVQRLAASVPQQPVLQRRPVYVAAPSSPYGYIARPYPYAARSYSYGYYRYPY